MQSVMAILNPQQKNQANNFLNCTDEQKAQQIADYCNKNGISKQQLQDLFNQFNN